MTLKSSRLARSARVLLVSILASAGLAAQAQESYPSRPIQMIIALSAGSQMDLLGRAVADVLSKQGGQAVVVLNRDGAGMAVGMDALAKSRPDGYTIGFGPDGPLSLSPHLYPNLPFKPGDFELICRTNNTNLMAVVGPQSPYKTFNDLIAAARQNPGKLSYGTPGTGTSMHLFMEAIALEQGVKFNHVPFKNIGDMTIQTLNGSLDFTVTVPNTLAANSARGMRGLVRSGDAPMADLPPMPLAREVVGANSPIAGYGVGNVGIFAPKGTPVQALAWLRSACKTAVESPGFLAVSAKTFTPVRYGDSSEFLRAMQGASQVSGDLVRKLNITLQ